MHHTEGWYEGHGVEVFCACQLVAKQDELAIVPDFSAAGNNNCTLICAAAHLLLRHQKKSQTELVHLVVKAKYVD
jgi:hypothetical protein